VKRHYIEPGRASLWAPTIQFVRLRIFPVPHPLLFLICTSLKVKPNMNSRTETLEIGSLAPYFSLPAANREGSFSLDSLLAEGKLVLEFLRGTW